MGHGEVRIAAKRYLRAVEVAGDEADRKRKWATQQHQTTAMVTAMTQAQTELVSGTGGRIKWGLPEGSATTDTGMLGQALSRLKAVLSPAK